MHHFGSELTVADRCVKYLQCLRLRCHDWVCTFSAVGFYCDINLIWNLCGWSHLVCCTCGKYRVFQDNLPRKWRKTVNYIPNDVSLLKFHLIGSPLPSYSRADKARKVRNRLQSVHFQCPVPRLERAPSSGNTVERCSVNKTESGSFSMQKAGTSCLKLARAEHSCALAQLPGASG